MLLYSRYLFFPAALLLAACGSDDRAIREQSLPAPPAPASSLAYSARVVPNPDSTFGYEVRRAGKPLIRQNTIPARPGTRGFADSTQARRVAQLVVGKLERGLMPPTVTTQELDSLVGSAQQGE